MPVSTRSAGPVDVEANNSTLPVELPTTKKAALIELNKMVS